MGGARAPSGASWSSSCASAASPTASGAATRSSTSGGRRALDPDALTLGFARRVATYKRLDLLLSAVDRAVALLGNGDRPVQMILAGKAHPRDDEGKRLVQRLFAMKSHPEVSRRVVYLDDYDFRLGAAMTRGCDVWVNVPRPPLEASGTSGMKSAINAGLQLAVLDGWWPEAYDGTTAGPSAARSITTTGRRTGATRPSSTG